MTKLEDLRKILQAHRKELNERYYVTEIGIFGSFVKNQQNDTSDVDILVEFNKGIDLLTFVNLKNFLSDLLKVNVDLVMKKALKPKIGHRILQEVVNIQKRITSFARYKELSAVQLVCGTLQDQLLSSYVHIHPLRVNIAFVQNNLDE